jgi:phenylalanine-4-hydroxylase
MFHDKIHTSILVDAEPPSSNTAEAGGGVPLSETPRTSVLMELTDGVGILHDVLKYFWKYDINVSRIESRPAIPDEMGRRRFDFFVDFEGGVGEANVDSLLAVLREKSEKFLILDEKEVQWFPRHISELDLIANRTLDAGTDLTSAHPGFNDSAYRARREELARLAKEHTYDRPISLIDYTKEEIDTWTAVWDQMEGLWDLYACAEFKRSMQLMKQHCGYSRSNIPQQRDISDFLKKTTKFQMRPVAGLLSSRDFLNGLAFRVFFSTQYIRHHSKPLYTPRLRQFQSGNWFSQSRRFG